MPLYEKTWWRKMFRREKETKVDVLKDIQAVEETLHDFTQEVKPLFKELAKLEELEKEYEVVAKEGLHATNLAAQEKIIDVILQRYEFFQNDVDINGIRVKEIAREFLRRAQKAGMHQLVKEKQHNMNWRFDW